MQLFYNPHILPSSTQAHFEKDESKHIIKVLRKKEGDILDITNGKGYFFKAKIIQASPSKCLVEIIDKKFQEPLPYTLHVCVAPTKTNDRYETFLEKATEIGVTEITPIICDHSERKVIKIERYERILQSAMKQSLKAYLPILNEPITLQEFLKSNTAASVNYIAHCEETTKQSLKEKLQHKPKDVTILIGPEGDFSPEEIAQAQNKNYIPVTLGNTRLRTETAAIVAVHSVAYAHE